jgi:N utilization substance protein A
MTATNFDLLEALQQMARDKGITVETLFDALANALVAAYKRLPSAAEEAVVTIDPDVGEIRVYGQELDDEGNVIREWDDTPADFGRIAAQAAKQVLMQRVREAERDRKYEEYAGREGDIVTGIIQQTDSRFTLLDLGKVEALLPQAEQVPYERYDHGARLKAYIVEVRKTTKGPQIVVSRSHPGLIKRLFELEVPEISNGIVEIKACAREPGHRTKIAVWSNDANVDPVGACVGARGARVRMVTTELRGEKVDIVPFSDDPAEFVARALQPAKVKEVLLDEERGRATVIVHDYQLSLAIGKEGQNARLAARLTGWHIDIRSESELAAEQAAYEQADWAEGEWVEDDAGEMVWRPAEGGESVSAEQWAAGGGDDEAAGAAETPVAGGGAEAGSGAAVAGGGEEAAGGDEAARAARPEAEAEAAVIAEVVVEAEAEVDYVAEVVSEAAAAVVDQALAVAEDQAAEAAAEAELEEEDEELEDVSVELELSAEDETEFPGVDNDVPNPEA